MESSIAVFLKRRVSYESCQLCFSRLKAKSTCIKFGAKVCGGPIACATSGAPASVSDIIARITGYCATLLALIAVNVAAISAWLE